MKTDAGKVLQTVQETIETYGMLNQVTTLLLGFSAGPDSVCLLDVLNRLYGRSIIMHLLYVDHGLRPKKHTNREVTLVKKFAQKYGIEYEIVPVLIKKGKAGLEATAREKRYTVFLKMMKKCGAQRIVLGHNSDDVIETFFLNLLRGSGPRGMKSIPAVRIPFVRPLIDLRKQDIVKYVKLRRLPYSIDETNRVLGHRRNLIRHTIVPELLKINPDLHETIKREIRIISNDDTYLEERAAAAYEKVIKRHEDYIFLDIKRLVRYNPALSVRLLMNVIKELRGSLDGYESKHFQAVFGLIDRESGKRISLPKGLYAQREYGNLVLGRVRHRRPKYIPVVIGKDIVLSDFVLKTRLVAARTASRRKREEVFDLAKLEKPLFLRTRKEGDYVRTKIGRKKMKKIFHEYKIPAHDRDHLLLLCDQRGILWIPGYVRAARAFVSEKTRRSLVVNFERAH
jgi:tRNA(Ile)-lysidine synthase